MLIEPGPRYNKSVMAPMGVSPNMRLLLWAISIAVHMLIRLQCSYACVSSLDCSLNGDCIDSTCMCDPAWSGLDCSALAFLPAPVKGGYRNATEASWGGYPIQDAEGTWHLFHAQMLYECSLNTWSTNSVIVRSTSASLSEPFTFQEVILGPFAHNPTIRRAPDGTYVLFYIGGWETKPQDCRKQQIGGLEMELGIEATTHAPTHAPTASLAECGNRTGTPDLPGIPFPGPTGDCCGPATEDLNGGCGLRLAHSSSLLGPWTSGPLNITVPPNYANTTENGDVNWMDCTHTNPSPAIDPVTGHVLLAFNAGYCHPTAHGNNLETIGLAMAPHWSGPYTLSPAAPDSQGVLFPGGKEPPAHRCEDPFIWTSHRGYHLIVHNQQPLIGDGSVISALGYSIDGVRWSMAPTAPYNCSVAWDDGTVSSAPMCGNRPHLVFSSSSDSDSDRHPIWLLNGAQDTATGRTYSLFRPIRTT